MKKILFLVSQLAITFVACSQTPLSLDEAIPTALRNKPGAQRAILDGELARQQLDETLRKYTPNITGELIIQYNPIIPTSIIPTGALNPQAPTDETRAVQFGQPWSNSAGVRGRQLLYSPALRSEVRERKIELAKAELNNLSETEKIRYNVSRAYYRALLAEEELKVAISDTVRAFELLRVASDRYALQQSKVTGRQQALYDLNNARFQYEKLKASATNARLDLLFNMGMPLDSDIQLSTTWSESVIDRTIDADSSTLSRRSDYRKAIADQQLFRQQVASERLKQLPEVSLNGFLGANQFSRSLDIAKSGSWFGNAFVNLNASIPLSAFYTQGKRIQQAKSRLSQSELALKDLQQTFDYETKVARNNLATAAKDYVNQQESLTLAKQLYEDVVNRFKEGQSLSSEVQDAAANVQESQYRVIKALYDVVMNQLELEKLTGFQK